MAPALTTADAPDWAPMVDALTQLQQVQWQFFSAWQQAVLAVQKELFDEWVCRWAGGVPIDA